jgi:hypothetical protein
VICGHRIVVSYFDEGVFGDVPPSPEGIAVYSQLGELEWGYPLLCPREVQLEHADARLAEDPRGGALVVTVRRPAHGAPGCQAP